MYMYLFSMVYEWMFVGNENLKSSLAITRGFAGH